MTVGCVGELMWDLHIEPGDSLETGERLRRVPGGAAANVAMVLAELGLDVFVLGSVSDDALGVGLCQALETRGVHTKLVSKSPGRTGLVFLERTATSGERFVSYRPKVAPMAVPSLPEGVRALHLAALNPDASELASFARLATMARERGAWLVIDVNARPRAWQDALADREALGHLFDLADVVKISDGDLATLARSIDRPLELVRRARTVILTQAQAPTLLEGAFGSLSVTPPAVSLVRSIGAGDAFCAGLLAHLEDQAPARGDAEFWRRALASAHARAKERITQPW